MLDAYFDESGTHDGSEVFVVAGLVAPVAQWTALIRGWCKELERLDLAHFHMADCCHGSGEFSRISLDDRMALIKDLVELTRRYIRWRVWCAIVVRDFYRLYPDSKHAGTDRLYTLAAAGCGSSIGALGSPSRRCWIPVCFDRGGKGGGHALKSFRNMFENPGRNVWGVGPVTTEDRKRIVPLQAADLHAYEVHKHLSEQLMGTGRPIRRSLQELLNISEVGDGGLVFDAKNILTLGEKLLEAEPDPATGSYVADVQRTRLEDVRLRPRRS